MASTFSVRGFTHIALVARDKTRLEKDQDTVLDAIQERGYSCIVRNWSCDLTDFDQLNKTLGEVEKFGQLECVLFNAARVAGRPPLEETVEAIENDFRLTNIALYKTAQWAIPILQKAGPESSPSFFVTSTTLLYKEPVPELVSLSMVGLHYCWAEYVDNGAVRSNLHRELWFYHYTRNTRMCISLFLALVEWFHRMQRTSVQRTLRKNAGSFTSSQKPIGEEKWRFMNRGRC